VTTTVDLGILIREPADAYHAKAGEYLTSHLLADFRKCPLLYHRKRLGLVVEKDQPSYIVGRATHVLVLEGRDRYEAEYAVGGPINPTTGKPFGQTSKKFAQWLEAQGKPFLKDDHAIEAEQMASAVKGHEAAMTLLSEGVPEGVVRAEYCGVPCQVRVDWLSPDYGIIDLKTCNNLTWFESDARKFGYAYQLAFYRAVLAQALEQTLLPVHLIAVEKAPPQRVGVWVMGQDVLAVAQKENEEAIGRLLECERTDSWPTGYEEPRIFDYL